VSSNPFAPIAAVPTMSNPFQVNKPSQPSMNQLRAAQTNHQFGVAGSGSASSYSNASALDSLFNSSSSTITTTAPMSSLSNHSSSQQQPPNNWSSAFPTFPTAATTQSPNSPNNPFAM